jgi:hypothetical protein
MIDRCFGKFRSFAAAVVIAFLLLAASSGCSNNGSQRVAVWGDVTWKDKPVPTGIVYFSPDTKKGNKGPQGFALIKNGHYDSRDARSKGCVTGPQVVIVQGCNGEGISGTFPYGRPLFASYEMPVEVSAEGGQMDLKIPDSVPPATAASGSDVE